MPQLQVEDPETGQPVFVDWEGEGLPTKQQIPALAKAAREKALAGAPKPLLPRLIDAYRETAAELEASQQAAPAFGGELWAARRMAEFGARQLAKVRRPVDWTIGQTLRLAAERSKANLADPAKRAALAARYGPEEVQTQEEANTRRLAAAQRMIGGEGTLGSEYKVAVGAPQTSTQAVSDTLLGTGIDFTTDPATPLIAGVGGMGRLGAQLQYVLGLAMTGSAGESAVKQAAAVAQLAKDGKLSSPQTAAVATEAVLSTLLTGFGIFGFTRGLSVDGKLAAVELKQAADYYAKRNGLGPDAAGKTFREAMRSLGDNPDPRTPEFQRLVAELKGASQKAQAQAGAFKMDAQTAKDTADIARGTAQQAEAMGNFKENASVDLAQRLATAVESARLEKSAVREQLAGQNPKVTNPREIDPRLAEPAVAQDAAIATEKLTAAELAKSEADRVLGKAKAAVTRVEKQRGELPETPPEVADLVDRLGAAVRGQQFARSFEWKPALREVRQKVAGELTALRKRFVRGELTADEYAQEAGSVMAQKPVPPSTKGAQFAPDELDALHTHIAASPDLTPYEAQRASAALNDLVSGAGASRKLITKGDVELLNVAFGKRFLDAQFTRPFTERLANAKQRLERVKQATLPFENDYLAARNELKLATRNLSASAKAAYKQAAAPWMAKIKASYDKRVEDIKASLIAEAAPKRQAYEQAVENRTAARKAATAASHRGQELVDMLDPQTGKVGSVRPPSITRQLVNMAADLAFAAPRAIQASDLGSWIFRQGAMLAYHGIFTRPGQTARTLGGGIADYFNKSHYNDVTRVAIDTHPAQTLVKPMKLRLGNQGEGLYESGIAHKLPVVGEALVKPSERSFASLDKLRLDVASLWDKALREQGFAPETHPEMYARAGDIINAFTGTSRFPKIGSLDLEKAAPFLGSVAFAPRYVYSTVAMPFKVARAAAVARPVAKLAAGPTASFVAAWAGILMAGKMLTGATVETDSNSADFLKLKVGNSRFDLGRGLVQAMVLGSRMASGEYKSSSTGEVTRFAAPRDLIEYARTNVWPKHPKGDTNALTLLYRFLESKEAPIPSYLSDVARGGKDIMGRTADLNPLTRFQPFAKRDIEEAAAAEPSNVPAAVLASQFGVGVQTYAPKTTRSADELEAEKLRKEQSPPKAKTPDEKLTARVTKAVRAGHEAKIRTLLKRGDRIGAYKAWLSAKVQGYSFPDLRKLIVAGYDNPDENDASEE